MSTPKYEGPEATTMQLLYDSLIGPMRAGRPRIIEWKATLNPASEEQVLNDLHSAGTTMQAHRTEYGFMLGYNML